MKIYLLGNGPKISEICEALAGKKSELHIISADGSTLRSILHRRAKRTLTDPAAIDFSGVAEPLTPDDLIVVTHTEQPQFRAILTNIQKQGPKATVLAFTSGLENKLARDFPDVLFQSDRTIFRKEMRELIRQNSTRRQVSQLRDMVRERPHLLILIWGNPDPDALGAAVALKELLTADSKETTIAYTGEFTRTENRAMARTLKIATTKFKKDMINAETTIATVDAQPSFFLPDKSIPFDIVIDHHPIAEAEGLRYVDIRPEYGSTASILTEYFLHNRISIPRRVATALYLGLKIDTNNLTRNVGDPDVDAFRHLRHLADEDVIRVIQLSKMPMAMLDHFVSAINRNRMAGDVSFCYLGDIDNPDTCVHIADFLVKVNEISWTVVSCRAGEKVIVVFRSNGYRKHAGKVAESLFAPYGTAGGHKTMARAELQVKKLSREIKKISNETIEEWLLNKIGERLRPLARLTKRLKPRKKGSKS